MAFDLHLQGGFELAPAEDGDTPRPTRRVQAVIAFLAMAQGRPVRRDSLAALLWGDRSDGQARQSVRQALSQVRKALGPARSEALITDDDAVRLDGDRLRVDAMVIEHTASDPTPAVARRALQCFRGELLSTIGPVTGPFDDWLHDARSRQLNLLTAAAARLAQEDRGSLQDVQIVAALERLGALDPSSERLAQVDVQRLRDAGQQDLARARYETLQRRLAEEGSPAPAPAGFETGTPSATPRPSAPAAAAQDGDPALRRFRRWRWVRVGILALALAAGVWWLRPQAPTLAPALAIEAIRPLDQGPQTAELAAALSQSLPSAIAMIGGIPRDDTQASRYVLDGTLERMGEDSYRLFAQLEDRGDGRALFTRVFEASGSDLRGDVLRKLVVATDVAIGEGEQGRFEGTQDVEAWLLASAAIERMRTLTASGLADARELYAEALERDPEFLNVRTGLALSYLFDVFVGNDLDRERIEGLIDGLEAQSPVWPTVLVIRALLALTAGDHDSAVAASARARELSPNGAEISAMHGLMLLQAGRLEEAADYLDRAIALQAGPPAWVFWIKARGRRLAGDPQGALAILTAPGVPGEQAPLYLAERILAHAAAGDEQQALTLGRQLRQLAPDFDAAVWVATLPHRDRQIGLAEQEVLARTVRR